MSLHLESFNKELLQKASDLPPQISAVLSNIIMKQSANRGCEDYYKNITALISYPRYLFREDIPQKWTNGQTKDNICIVPRAFAPMDCTPVGTINGYYIYRFDVKAILFNCFIRYQENIFDIASDKDILRKKIAVKRIRFFNMEVHGRVTVNTAEEIVSVMRDIDESEYNMKSFCAVLHQDEESPHVHFIYHLDPSCTVSERDLKKCPHINAVIKEVYNL